VTPARRRPRVSRRRSPASSAWAVPCVISGTIAAFAAARTLPAQVRAEAPVAPAATIGPVTDAPTLSLLGMASLPDGSTTLAQRNDLWLGATQPIGSLGRVRFSAVGSGTWRLAEGSGSEANAQGVLALRARARLGGQQLWSAVSYGHGRVDGLPTTALIADAGLANATSFEARMADTSISRRVDVGHLGRAEAGVVTRAASVEFSFGMSVEHATRVTTQTLVVNEAVPVSYGSRSRTSTWAPPVNGGTATYTQRTLQRRDVASGIASVGFDTGPTTWLLSVTAPVASWISADALAPSPQHLPAVASLAVVQPVGGWLSLIAAASTNPSSMGGMKLGEQVNPTRDRNFAPVVAIGVRFSRMHDRDANGTPNGILSFESRTLGAVDSISVTDGASVERIDGDTLRVVLLIDAPRAERVELMGDATEWSVVPMRRNVSGRWRAELKLPPGVHRVMVRADGGRWSAPPGVPVANDDYGGPVGMIVIRGQR